MDNLIESLEGLKDDDDLVSALLTACELVDDLDARDKLLDNPKLRAPFAQIVKNANDYLQTP